MENVLNKTLDILNLTLFDLLLESKCNSSKLYTHQNPTPLQYSSHPSFYPSSNIFVNASIFSGLVPSCKTEHSKK